MPHSDEVPNVDDTVQRPDVQADVDGNTHDATPTSPPQKRATPAHPRKKRQTTATAETAMEYALNELQAMSSNSEHNSDDAHTMGMLVEHELRSMEHRQRSIAKKLISDVLFNGNLGMLHPTASIMLQHTGTPQHQQQQSWENPPNDSTHYHIL